MKNTDRALIAIVVGIVLLVVLAAAAALSRGQPQYRAEDTPEGVGHNYLLAVFQGDFERAYTYLSPDIRNLPASAEEFRSQVRQDEWQFARGSDVSVNVISADVDGELAIVKMRQQRFYGGGLFDSSTSTDDFELTLKRQDGSWKIVNGDLYFFACWTDPNNGYPCK